MVGMLLGRKSDCVQNGVKTRILKEKNVKRITVEEVDLSVRTYNCLKNMGIQYLDECKQYNRKQLLKTRNFGRKSLRELENCLAQSGISLSPSPKDFVQQEFKKLLRSAENFQSQMREFEKLLT